MELPPIVADDAALAVWVDHLAAAPLAGVDTESNGFHAYRERVCLIQVATAAGDCVIDPLADVDLTSLLRWLADPGAAKVMHGAEFDVLSLKRDFDSGVAGLFDTMQAARLAGRKGLGLDALAGDLLGLKLDKRFQRHDWGRRPLDPKAVEYARRDARCLLPLHDRLAADVRAAGAADSLDAACRRIEAMVPRPRTFDPDAFRKLRGYDALSADGRRAVRRLFLWREEVARRRDVAPFRVLGPPALVAVAAAQPTSLPALQQVRGVPRWLVRSRGDELLRELARAGQDDDPGARRRRRRRKGDGRS